VCRHVFAHLRPNHKTTALSAVPGCAQSAELPLPRIPTSRSNVSRLPFPDSSPRSPVPSLARSSIAAPTTASAFLQASLSKMPRSHFSLPQHPAPRHFRSRLTTSRTSGISIGAMSLRSRSFPSKWITSGSARDLGTISLMAQSRSGREHSVSRFENQFLRTPVQNFRDIEFVFRWTCYLVDPPELP
jgi:hypothetical protein